MRRREFITLLGGAAVTWPLAALGQQPKKPVIGYLSTDSPQLFEGRLRTFHAGLREMGFVDGENVTVEYGWAHGQYDRLPALAMDMVHRQVNAIVSAGGVPAALAAKAATTTIPIIFRVGGDPVAFGLVASLNRPGGNMTGFGSLTVELGPKKLELLHEMIPSATRIAMLVNPTNPAAATDVKISEEAARTLGLELHVLNAMTEREIDSAFADRPPGGLLVAADLFFNNRVNQIVSLATRYAVPAAWSLEFARAGGLIGYGAGRSETDRVVGVYAGRILKGEKPANMPVQQSTKVELIINMKTAKALGLEVPPTLLARADEVIE